MILKCLPGSLQSLIHYKYVCVHVRKYNMYTLHSGCNFLKYNLFVYDYNIQGVFIFLLHVIRNKQVNMCVYWSPHGNFIYL